MPALLAAAFVAACCHSGAAKRDLPAPSGVTRPDTSITGAYTAVLTVAWDSVISPTFPRAGRIPVVLWDSSVSQPLRAERAPLPDNVLRELKQRGLADAHCPSLATAFCTTDRPVWWVVLIGVTCRQDTLCVSGFQEQVIEGLPGPRLDGSAWRVVLRRSRQGWVVVEASLQLTS